MLHCFPWSKPVLWHMPELCIMWDGMNIRGGSHIYVGYVQHHQPHTRAGVCDASPMKCNIPYRSWSRSSIKAGMNTSLDFLGLLSVDIFLAIHTYGRMGNKCLTEHIPGLKFLFELLYLSFSWSVTYTGTQARFQNKVNRHRWGGKTHRNLAGVCLTYGSTMITYHAFALIKPSEASHYLGCVFLLQQVR